MCFFFFNDTATTEIYTLSLHDALPIYRQPGQAPGAAVLRPVVLHLAVLHVEPQHVGPGHLVQHGAEPPVAEEDRKSTRLNSSHANISYAVFCLKKKKRLGYTTTMTKTI